MDVQPLWDWVNERHAVYWRKTGTPAECVAAGVPHRDLSDGFLTDDPVLRQYRFCNVFRELDRVTVWIRKNIREWYADHPHLWLMLAIARTINWPHTLEDLIHNSSSGYNDLACWPDHNQFVPEDLGRALDIRKAAGEKVYTGAYMIRAHRKGDPWGLWTKQQYVARIVIGRLWEDREHWELLLNGDVPPGRRPTLEDVWMRFQHPRYIGWGPFMAYQVVVDMRHTRYLRDAPDINTWAALGPGSRRGLNRLAGRPLGYNLSQEEGLEEMLSIWGEQDRYRAPWVPRIELSDIQNCLCETDKYLRVKQGEGRPRALYLPGRGH